MRSIKISKINEVSEEILRDYIAEAIENQKAGMEIKVERGKVVEVPDLLMNELKKKTILFICLRSFHSPNEMNLANTLLVQNKKKQN